MRVCVCTGRKRIKRFRQRRRSFQSHGMVPIPFHDATKQEEPLFSLRLKKQCKNLFSLFFLMYQSYTTPTKLHTQTEAYESSRHSFHPLSLGWAFQKRFFFSFSLTEKNNVRLYFFPFVFLELSSCVGLILFF